MDMLRVCRRCGVKRAPCEFYKGATQCKPCLRSLALMWRHQHLDEARAYDRRRSIVPHRKEHAARITREWRRKHPDRLAAHNKAQLAGLKAPSQCEACQLPKRLEKHHPDYSKPLLVVWLCKPCHAWADKIRRQLESV